MTTLLRRTRLLLLGAFFAASQAGLYATEVVPLGFSQADITYNFRSQRGVPISGAVNVPPGSDGRLPSSNESGSNLPATTNQFRGFISFGAIAAPTNAAVATNLFAGTNQFSTAVARQMQLPIGMSNNTAVIIVRRAQIGAPYLSREISFLFGSVIPVPNTDENGSPLTNIIKELYWLPEPYSTSNHTNDQYYWSPHAQQVYAAQAGPITITWRKAASTGSAPPDYATNAANYEVVAGQYFRLYTKSYIVSGSPVKTPQKIYWTEKGFQYLGKLVLVPSARVTSVNIIYNNNFPKTVPQEYVAPGQSSPTDGTTNAILPELRTLWFDSGSIHAYNAQGRVFVELLGDLNPDGKTRVQLGYELVDVSQSVNPVDLTIELGERVTPAAPGTLTTVFPEPILQPSGITFSFTHSTAGSDTAEIYATRETANLNDFLIHWMDVGVAGIRWPSQLARYKLVWPADIAHYSQYARPLVATETQAMQTAVQLSSANAPIIEYQDPLDIPRAKLTGDFKFYTFLSTNYPAHRTLLHFTSGDSIAFERVFSWLDVALANNNLAGSVATNLSAWNSTNNTLAWADLTTAPRVVHQTVEVGQRVTPPSGEIGSNPAESYLAGFIQQSSGTLFDVYAYADPFTNAAAVANFGSIIPVNAIPGANTLEIWWFRTNNADTVHGFATIYWPAVIGYYTIQWPSNPGEIVLAGNSGSANTDPLIAAGHLYYQNDPSLPGYNPNEEHALMNAGSAYALRDDLNVTNGPNYSSMPFVLVEYQAADGRPDMAVYKVLREKPEQGMQFDYVVNAGTLLQPPMPLGLLPPPTEGSGDSAVNYNTESSQAGGDLPGAWSEARDAEGVYGHYKRFTYRDRKQGFWVYRGLHAGLPALEAGTFTNHAFQPLPPARAVVGHLFSESIHVSRQSEYLALSANNLPPWLSVQGLSLQGTPAPTDAGTTTVELTVRDLEENVQTNNTITITVATNGSVVAQAPLDVRSTNSLTGVITDFTNRPPFLAQSPVSTNSFTMRFYYKTLPGFAWPGIANPPTNGSIVPYLRALGTNNTYVGDPASKTNALDIVYRPVWPEADPVGGGPVAILPYGQSLTEATVGLPGVRDYKTAYILYQQSIAANITNAAVSAVLCDPTRQKISDLGAHGLTALPGSIATAYYQGKTYFPSLPPHLAQRLYYDPNIGTHGSLVLIGQFFDELVGDKYLLLNVLRDADLATVLALCPSGDPNYSNWTALVNNLTATVQTFVENPTIPGTYIADPAQTAYPQAGDLPVITNANTAVDSYALSGTGPGQGYITLLENSGTAFTKPGDPVAMHILKVGGSLYTGELKPILSANPLSEQITLQHTSDLAGRAAEYNYQWKMAGPINGVAPQTDSTMSNYLTQVSGPGLTRFIIGGAGIQALSDNYVTMRYSPANTNHPLYGQWSSWTPPQLAEGWIKRVLAGINPFNQRTSDLFDNTVNTDASIIQQAGHRWEGDIALNADTLNQHGLIEIYETVLRRGRSLSIDAGYNYGPANDALVLAAGYLNDLYMMLGNEATADADNPTIGIGTADKTYGAMATAMFSFQGEVPSLLEEQLALLRGRDDSLAPGVQVPPFYNRLVWNYTRGIAAGEVIYALNYNITDVNGDGVIDASDAALLFPQGHGDAYGHYLTALTGYYSLLMNPNFDWVPHIEAVTILGQTVAVGYMNERKFAAAAAALATAGQQVFDLEWRKDYQPGQGGGWDYLGTNFVNSTSTYLTTTGATNRSVRYWGLDHWATRVGQGDYFNWVVGNAILPAIDSDPTHQGIQKIDRTTVPELQELPTDGDNLQTALDNAEGHLTPLGLPEGSVAFDINPNQVVGGENGTHFEQIYERAKLALQNAVSAFDDAKDVTSLMRSEQDSLVDLQAGVDKQELAYTNALIELYGTPYPDDIGPGQLYPQGYAGPDLFHYFYVDSPQLTFPNLVDPNQPATFNIDIQTYSNGYLATANPDRFDFITSALHNNPEYTNSTNTYISFTLDSYGNYQKPPAWTSTRATPGKIQEAISRIFLARNAGLAALADNQALKRKLDVDTEYFSAKVANDALVHDGDHTAAILQSTAEAAQWAGKLAFDIYKQTEDAFDASTKTAMQAIPQSTIVGTADGGDLLAPARAAILASYAIAQEVNGPLSIAKEAIVGGLQVTTDDILRQKQADVIVPAELDLEDQRMITDLDALLGQLHDSLYTINQRLQELDAAVKNYQALVGQGNQIQQERQLFRQRTAAVIQGYRTRDAAFRLFRNEKLERYKTLFDLAGRYAYLAANAYDFETGLLNTPEGQSFLNRIISTRSLGVVVNGEPQYAGSDTGDPGLSSALAEMKADWDVVKGRLGFNSPDAYGTTVSLRVENYRILPDTNGLANWQDLLRQSRKANLLDDGDVRRYCMQIDPGDGLPVPGFIFEFSTTIAPGYNLFGKQLAAGDHAYSPSSFATKIFAAGVAMPGYRGMDAPAANGSGVGGAGGTSPTDPPQWYLDSLALSATPYIYLIPVGVDSMRSPPLGDVSTIRTWDVNDVAVPLPFNIGASGFSTKPLYLSSDSLTEPLFTLRKHQAFRPVPDSSFFSTSLYGVAGTLQRSQYTNNRLIARSVWNSKWKLVIPASSLLNDPNEAMDRFIQTVNDLQIHFVTYSYSGN